MEAADPFDNIDLFSIAFLSSRDLSKGRDDSEIGAVSVAFDAMRLVVHNSAGIWFVDGRVMTPAPVCNRVLRGTTFAQNSPRKRRKVPNEAAAFPSEWTGSSRLKCTFLSGGTESNTDVQ
jgi:hypothetical protein